MKKPLIPQRAMIPLGLFITSATFLISHDWVKMPDFLTGGLTGLGIGIMIVGLVMQGKKRRCEKVKEVS